MSTATRDRRSETLRTLSAAEGEPGSRYSGSLPRGLLLLRCFSLKEPVLGIADLSDRTGLTRSSTHRYARTLLAHGYLEQLPSRKYRLGRLALDLGLAALRVGGLGELARPWLAWMRARTGFTASLGLLDGQGLVYVAWLASRVEGQAEQAMARRVGWSVAAHGCAAGLALLAYVDVGDWPEASRACASRGRGGLLEELGIVCERGYAVCEGPAGVAGVAAAVLGVSEPVAAVELTVFGDRLGVLDLWGLSGVVVEAARGIAEQLEEDSRTLA